VFQLTPHSGVFEFEWLRSAEDPAEEGQAVAGADGEAEALLPGTGLEALHPVHDAEEVGRRTAVSAVPVEIHVALVHTGRCLAR
jgi:hypothetical protein